MSLDLNLDFQIHESVDLHVSKYRCLFVILSEMKTTPLPVLQRALANHPSLMYYVHISRNNMATDETCTVSAPSTVDWHDIIYLRGRAKAGRYIIRHR